MDISLVLLMLPALLFSIICHEIGHAYAAYMGGDDTARLQGRLSFNPIVHIDPIGTIVVPLILFLSPSPFLFGWARPVPVNPANLRSRKWDLAVSLAGVTVNLALAITALFLLKVLHIVGFAGHLSPGMMAMNPFDIVVTLLNCFVLINLILMIFNLLPIPPLDGSHVLLHFIRRRDSFLFSIFEFLERFGFFILIFLLWSGGLSAILWPILDGILRAFLFVSQLPQNMTIF
jgi:Zn-dependent protease